MMIARLLSALLTLMSLSSNICVNIGGDALLVGDRLTLYTEPGVYAQAYPLGSTGFYALREKQSGYCLITDRYGNPVTEPVFDAVEMCGENIIIKYNGLWALCDRALNRLTGWSYSAIFPAGDNCYAFRGNLWDDKADELFILDLDGRERASGSFLLYTDLTFSEGQCASINAATKRYGYIDASGRWMRDAQYVWAGDYVAGLAPVRTEEGGGVIDAEGNWILSPVFEQVALSENYVICREKGLNAALYVYSRTELGLILLPLESSGHAAALGEYFAVYTDEYVYLCDGQAAVKAVFSADTRLQPGFASQVIARDKNGVYVYDVESGEMSAFYAFVERLTGIEAYLCAEEEKGELFFGAMTKDGGTLLKTEYERINAPAPNMLAAVAEEELYLYYLDADVPVLVLHADLRPAAE